MWHKNRITFALNFLQRLFRESQTAQNRFLPYIFGEQHESCKYFKTKSKSQLHMFYIYFYYDRVGNRGVLGNKRRMWKQASRSSVTGMIKL